jgi:hypothetical protein
MSNRSLDWQGWRGPCHHVVFHDGVNVQALDITDEGRRQIEAQADPAEWVAKNLVLIKSRWSCTSTHPTLAALRDYAAREGARIGRPGLSIEPRDKTEAITNASIVDVTDPRDPQRRWSGELGTSTSC